MEDRAAQIKLKPEHGATNATSMAVVKPDTIVQKIASQASGVIATVYRVQKHLREREDISPHGARRRELTVGHARRARGDP